jgi:hypothetical protein
MSSESRIAARVAAINKPPSHRAIPWRIMQTFETAGVPLGMREASMSWVRTNPDHDYEFSDNEARRLFVRERFGGQVLEAYDRLKIGAFRADLWRYCALYVHGGVYADLDTVCRLPMREFLECDDEFVIAQGAAQGALFNAFICSVPGHRFLAVTIERVVHNILSGSDGDGYAVAGPRCIGAAINLETGNARDASFLPGAHTVNGYSFRILEKVHTPDPTQRKVVDNQGRTVLLCKYDGYEADLAHAGVRHWAAGPGAGECA